MVLPVMTPVLTVVLVLSTIFALNAFEVETVLGFAIRFFVFSTQIYFTLQQQPPLYAASMALSTIVLAAVVPLIFVQRWASSRRRFTTVLFVGTPILRGLYGTNFLLVLATIVSSMTTTVQLLKSNLAQLGNEIEESARVEGGSWFQAMRHVLLPIMRRH